jgi:hypothetical protein
MDKKRGFVVLAILTILLLLVISCGKNDLDIIPSVSPEGPTSPITPIAGGDTAAFIHSLPNMRDATASTFGSFNVFIDDFIVEFDANKVLTDIYAAPKVSKKAADTKEVLSNIDLIVSDFGKNKVNVNLNKLSGADTALVNSIDAKLESYANNRAKLDSCVAGMQNYAEFVGLTAEREKLIEKFTVKFENAGGLIEKNEFDRAIALGGEVRNILIKLKENDIERSKLGVLAISSDLLFSWDLHLEATDILIGLWKDLKVDKMDDAMDKAQKHYNTFSRANKYGEEAPMSEQAASVNVWLSSNVGSCKGLLG